MIIEEEDCAAHHRHTADCAWHWGVECERCVLLANEGRTGCPMCILLDEDDAESLA